MKLIVGLTVTLLAIGAIGCSQLDSADAEALDRLLRWEEERTSIEGPRIRVQNHSLCRWVIDDKPRYGNDPTNYDESELVNRYGHGLRWWTESYEGVRDLAIQLGAANPDIVVSEWCEKRDTPPLAYTPTPE